MLWNSPDILTPERFKSREKAAIQVAIGIVILLLVLILVYLYSGKIL